MRTEMAGPRIILDNSDPKSASIYNDILEEG